MKSIEYEDGGGGGGGGGGTVVVGVTLDQQSKELLTWALVKVAQSGDRVIALHVLTPSTECKSTPLSLVKTFDSVLSAYEGFCSLKQVDLKLKVCRGFTVRKVLVCEAKSYGEAKVIVGTSRTHHVIRSSVSVAKYCARKLPKNFSIFAVHNGKVVFQQEATTSSIIGHSQDCDRNENYVRLIPRSLSQNSKVLNDDNAVKSNRESEHYLRKSSSERRRNFSVPTGDNGKVVFQREATSSIFRHSRDRDRNKNFVRLIPRSLSQNSKVLNDDTTVKSNRESRHSLRKSSLERRRNTLISKYLGCAPNAAVFRDNNSCTQLMEEESGDDSEDNSLALVPIQTSEPVAGSNSESKSGWPLLRRVFLRDQQSSVKSSVSKMSMVRWVLRPPSRNSSAVVYPDQKPSNSDPDEGHSSNLDGENGAIVPVGIDAASPPRSPFNGLKRLPKELEGLHEKYSSTCRLFSYRELLSAMSNFMPENMVGKGGSSQVYRGCLPDGKELAIKILKPSEDVLKEFVLEIEIITTLHHKNIISLFGFCFEDNNLILVYDFVSRGSLEENLHGNKKDGIAFGWAERHKVALGVAEALDYLHNGSAQPIVHRDVKSSNILLSDDFEPQLSDFGLATWASTLSHISCSDVAGTFGYLAPEYFMHGKVNDKIDVYAFGVVLLELLSGRKPINSEYPKGPESLVMWAKPILKGGKVSQLVDPSLDSNYDHDQIGGMVLAATLCIRRAPRFRPQIGLVLKLLEGDTEVTKWARQQVCASEEFDAMDGEAFPTNFQSHLNLALLDLEDGSFSISSNEQNVSVEDYLQGRQSRSSSFD